MKSEILSALKTKYKNLGLSDKVFDGVAEMLSKTITEKEKIDEGITGIDPLLKSFQGEVDRYRTESAMIKKQLEEKQETKIEQKADSLTLEDVKKLLEDSDKKRQEKEDRITSFKNMKDAAKKELLKKEGVKAAVVDKILSRIGDSDGATVDSIVKNVQDEYEYLLKEFTPEAGLPYMSLGGGGDAAPSNIKSFCEKKKAGFKEAQERESKIV